MTTHVSNPHEPGQLYDCPACESECFCGNRTPPGDNPGCCGLAACLPGACHTECVYCAILSEPYDPAAYTPITEVTYRDGSGRTATAYVPPF